MLENGKNTFPEIGNERKRKRSVSVCEPTAGAEFDRAAASVLAEAAARLDARSGGGVKARRHAPTGWTLMRGDPPDVLLATMLAGGEEAVHVRPAAALMPGAPRPTLGSAKRGEVSATGGSTSTALHAARRGRFFAMAWPCGYIARAPSRQQFVQVIEYMDF